MPSLIFLCVQNSARSQMAEGLARAQAPSGWEVYSAGSRPGTLHPVAVEVMREVGIDISGHHAKPMDDVPLEDADVVITLCAEEECPVGLTRARRLAWELPDPAGGGTPAAFRTVRDELAARLRRFWDAGGSG